MSSWLAPRRPIPPLPARPGNRNEIGWSSNEAGIRRFCSLKSVGNPAIDVLVIDDWAMAPMKESERRDFWEICEDRYQARSMILTSQMPVSKWHEQIGDPTVADGILDRIVHNAHRIEMRGDSMRKKRKGEEPAGKDPAGGA